MDAILNAGISFILWFQGLGTWLVGPMKFFTFLGSEEFFLIALPLLYWCVDSNAGLRIGVIVLFTGGLNDILKLSFHGPRPYWFSTQVKVFSAETSFGVPSGHAQIATGLWGMAAAQIKRRWFWFLAVIVILMIGLSRLFLAVHFPHDVIFGWVVGALVLWIFLRWWDAAAAWVKKKSLAQQIAMAFGSSTFILLCGIIAFGALSSWTLPADWLANAQQSGVEPLPSPVSLNGIITTSALMFGMLAGLAWSQSQGGFDVRGTLGQRALRLLPGLLGTVILYFGLRAIFPRGDAFVPYFMRYLRYALIGLWVTAGAPWVFLKLNLARKKEV